VQFNASLENPLAAVPIPQFIVYNKTEEGSEEVTVEASKEAVSLGMSQTDSVAG
jgi:hypothetical protein